MSLFVLQELSFPSFLKHWAPRSFFPFVYDGCALWFSLVLISQGVLLFMCFAAELSPSHSTLTFILTFSVRLSFRHRTFTWKWNGSLRVGVGAACYTYDGIKFSCCDNCWSFYCGIRQGSKRNDDSVSVEELDWSAENQVLIPAEHLWCDFECRPWATNSPPNTKQHWLVHSLYGQKYWDTPFFRREKGTSKLWQQRNSCS